MRRSVIALLMLLALVAPANAADDPIVPAPSVRETTPVSHRRRRRRPGDLGRPDDRRLAGDRQRQGGRARGLRPRRRPRAADHDRHQVLGQRRRAPGRDDRPGTSTWSSATTTGCAPTTSTPRTPARGDRRRDRRHPDQRWRGPVRLPLGRDREPLRLRDHARGAGAAVPHHDTDNDGLLRAPCGASSRSARRRRAASPTTRRAGCTSPRRTSGCGATAPSPVPARPGP